MGTIIGRQGLKIKHIQDVSGVRMVAQKEMLPQSTERIVEVQGTPEGIQKAVWEICKCLVDDWQRGTGTVLYNPVVRTQPSATGGIGGGQGLGGSPRGDYNNSRVMRTGNGADFSEGGPITIAVQILTLPNAARPRTTKMGRNFKRRISAFHRTWLGVSLVVQEARLARFARHLAPASASPSPLMTRPESACSPSWAAKRLMRQPCTFSMRTSKQKRCVEAKAMLKIDPVSSPRGSRNFFS
jgi:hypothetical protein